jgi:hypothetical protein
LGNRSRLIATNDMEVKRRRKRALAIIVHVIAVNKVAKNCLSNLFRFFTITLTVFLSS